MMTDAQINQELQKLVRITNKLAAEAKRRFGQEGQMFYESGGSFNMMEGDTVDAKRTDCIRFYAEGASMDARSW